ncbi:MAG TPA: hypothetical protein VMT66_07130 [Steroidobacteraceae bacterium]|nr:hypothetical protein [Steroidobacteraceae bacterium]
MFARFPGPRSRARRAARVLHQQPVQVASEEVRILIATVEDLIQRLAVAADPELKRLRKQSETALANAKSALAQGGTQLRERLSDLGEQGQHYVRRRPLASLGMVAVGMLLIGLVASRSITSD